MATDKELALVLDGLIDSDALTHAMAQAAVFAWTYCDYPQDVLANERWLILFKRAGYVENKSPTTPPAGPLRLYRGQLPAFKTNWSWTGSIEVARSYADHMGAEARIWTILADGQDLFGHFTERDEDEYILLPDVERVEPFQG